MILVFTPKITSRITYVFKHIFTRILGVDVSFTNTIEQFLAFDGAKLSYGKQPLGNEFFIKSHGLLQEQGIESVEISVKDFETTRCFFYTKDTGDFPFDIFAASFYLLSRYEEYLPHVKDSKGRFTAKHSIAYKHQFLKQPIVDVWAYHLKKRLLSHNKSFIFPTIKQKSTVLIDASQPFQFQQKGMFRHLVASVKDLSKGNWKQVLLRLKVLLGGKKDPYNTFNKIISILKTSNATVCFFFLVGQPIHFEDGFQIHKNKFKLLLKYVGDYKKVGALFSHNALFDLKVLTAEKAHIESITNRPLYASFNTQLQLNLPDTYRDLVSVEITNDYTMAYPNKVGFRAGTCTPFLFYDLDYEIITPLILHPVCMTSQALSYLKKSTIFNEIESIKKEVSEVNGHFNVLFKNSDITHKQWGAVATQLLKKMA